MLFRRAVGLRRPLGTPTNLKERVVWVGARMLDLFSPKRGRRGRHGGSIREGLRVGSRPVCRTGAFRGLRPGS